MQQYLPIAYIRNDNWTYAAVSKFACNKLGHSLLCGHNTIAHPTKPEDEALTFLLFTFINTTQQQCSETEY